MAFSLGLTGKLAKQFYSQNSSAKRPDRPRAYLHTAHIVVDGYYHGVKSIECFESRSIKRLVLISDTKARSYEGMQEVYKVGQFVEM